MTKARKTIINVNDTPYYHCMGRCVRRAFLCGVDDVTGKDFSHRKQWLVDKLTELEQVFMIDVCAYAVMSNHYHLVLKINHEQAMALSDDLVIEHWMRLFKGNVLIQRYLKGECKSEGEINKVNETISLWRKRLSDISWFMRCLNETIAHMSNKEDNCTGRFWEGRFKSQALLNEQALLSCMAYVDLNPVRAGIAKSLDTSEFTSIKERIWKSNVECSILNVELENQEKIHKNKNKEESKPIKLADFVESMDNDGIPYRLMDYLELVDWTGRAIRDVPQGILSCHKAIHLNKHGYIDSKEPKIIDKLGFTSEIWLKSVDQFSDNFYSHIGTEEQLNEVCKATKRKWIAGIKQSRVYN